MKIFYVTNARLPTEKAHGLATVKLSEAFARQGADVTVLAPWRLNPLKRNPYEYYGAERNFGIQYLLSIDFLWLPFAKRLWFGVQLFSFSVVAALWVLLRYRLWGGLRDAVIFSHDHVPLFFASFVAPVIVYDIHDYPMRNSFYRRVLRCASGFAVQTRWKAGMLAQDFGIPAEHIVYWPNGTDVERFATQLSHEEARAKLGLAQQEKIVLYAGSLQRWKGVETLVEASKHLLDAKVYIVGGSPTEIAALQQKEKSQKLKAVFVGQKPWQEIPLWLKAADVLVLPNTGQEKVSQFYTSPMKLFEYMASGRPIVASDIPSIREIVDEAMVYFAAPDDPHSFAAAIRAALANPEEARRRAERAAQEVRRYTWEARARRILEHMRGSW